MNNPEPPPNRLSAEERYRRDVQFKALVDTLQNLIHHGQYTPTELREAAVLAATRYYQYSVYDRLDCGPPTPPSLG